MCVGADAGARTQRPELVNKCPLPGDSVRDVLVDRELAIARPLVKCVRSAVHTQALINRHGNGECHYRSLWILVMPTPGESPSSGCAARLDGSIRCPDAVASLHRREPDRGRTLQRPPRTVVATVRTR